MRSKGWIRVIALVMVALAAFAAVESVTCAEDFGACCEESTCCGCVHVGLTTESLSAEPFIQSSIPGFQVFEVVPSWKSEPLFRPPIA